MMMLTWLHSVYDSVVIGIGGASGSGGGGVGDVEVDDGNAFMI